MRTDRYDGARRIGTTTGSSDVVRRHRPSGRVLLVSLLAGHATIHLLGFAGARGVVRLPLFAGPVSPWAAGGWLVAGLLCAASAVVATAAPRWWWVTGLVAVTVSQAVILTAWSQAWAGTAVNLLLLVAVVHGVASRGPGSLRAEYEHTLTAAWPAQPESIITEAHLVGLPEVVQRYLWRVGVVGRPPVRNFRATWTGRMRGSPTSAWMPFTADQLDFVAERHRYFKMDATMRGLPVDVLHVFDDDGATMRVRLFSLRSMVDASGPVLTRAETVTLFNDLCLYAPSALTEPAIVWGESDTHSATAHFTVGPNTVTATLYFDDQSDLVDFVSDDRVAAAADGQPRAAVRWSTPIGSYALFGSARVPARADVRWHPADGTWTYGEFTLTSLSYNTGSPERPGEHHATRHMVPPSPLDRDVPDRWTRTEGVRGRDFVP